MKLFENKGNNIFQKIDYKNMLTESKLGSYIQAKTNFPNADFWIIRRDSINNVGKPVKEFNSEHIGIKIISTNVLIPDYLFYLLTYIHNSGYFKQLATGTTNLVNIKVSDITNIPIKNT